MSTLTQEAEQCLLGACMGQLHKLLLCSQSVCCVLCLPCNPPPLMQHTLALTLIAGAALCAVDAPSCLLHRFSCDLTYCAQKMRCGPEPHNMCLAALSVTRSVCRACNASRLCCNGGVAKPCRHETVDAVKICVKHTTLNQTYCSVWQMNHRRQAKSTN